MRILVAIFAILTILLGGAYFIAFTQSGNNIVKPYLEDFISKKVEKNVKLDKFTLTMSHLSLQANVPNEATLIIDGDIKLFDNWFNLLYHIQAQNLKTPTMIIRNRLEVDGSAKGFLSDFVARGKGKAFSSNINFDIHLIDSKPTDGNINAKGVSISQVLELLGKPAYTSGLLDITARVENKNEKLTGNANILIHKSTLNSELIKRDFNTTLPKNLSYVGKIDGYVKDNSLNLKSQIVSTLATLKTEKTKIDLKSMDILSDYDLKVPSLEKLSFLTGKKLYGDLHVNGDLKKSGDELHVNANSEVFDGIFNGVLNKNILRLSGRNFQIKKILSVLGEPAMAYGIVNFKAQIDDVKREDKHGSLELDIKNGELVGTHMKSKFELDFPPITNFSGLINAQLSGDKIVANSDLKSSLVNLKTQKTTINTNGEEFYSDFDIDISNLTKIGKIIKQDLKGTFAANGDVSFANKQLSFSGHTNSLDGSLDATLKDGKLDATLKDVSVEKIIYLLNKPNFAKGTMNATAKFSDINKESMTGTFNYTLNNGLLLGDGLKELTDTEFPSSSPFAIKSDIDVKNSVAYFTNSINSELASITQFKGSYDINKEILDSQYNIDIKDLSKLEFITKQKFHGSLMAKGIVQFKDKNLKFTADAPILGGQTRSDYDKNILTTKGDNLSIKGLSKLLDIPYVFESKGDLDLDYNTNSKKGKYTLIMNNGHMVENQLGTLVKTLSGYDMTSEVYEKTTLKGDINDTKVSYILDMNGTQTTIKIPNGVYDMVTKQTDASFHIKFQKTDLSGKIVGDINDPKVKLSSSKYLEDKAIKEIEKHVPEKQKGLVKDILKLF